MLASFKSSSKAKKQVMTEQDTRAVFQGPSCRTFATPANSTLQPVNSAQFNAQPVNTTQTIRGAQLVSKQSVNTVQSVNAPSILSGTQTGVTNQPLKSRGNKLTDIFARIKKVKNIEIYIAVVLIVIMVGIYLSTLAPSKASSSANSSITQTDYARVLEERLEKTLAQISGAGNVSVMVTIKESATLELAWNIDEKTITQTGSGGISTTTTTIVKTPVTVNGQPLVLYEIMPKISGIVVVASGANDIAVRLNLMRAVQTLIVDNDVKIDIFAGK